MVTVVHSWAKGEPIYCIHPIHYGGAQRIPNADDNARFSSLVLPLGAAACLVQIRLLIHCASGSL